MKTRTEGVAQTTLKEKGIIKVDADGHTILDLTRFHEVSDTDFLKCRNVGEYTLAFIIKFRKSLSWIDLLTKK